MSFVFIILEGIFYGIYGTFFGGIFGIGLSRLMYTYINRLSGIKWALPWQAILIAGIVATFIGVVASMIPMKRI